MGLGVQGLGKKGDDMIQVLYKDMQGRVYGFTTGSCATLSTLYMGSFLMVCYVPAGLLYQPAVYVCT